MAATDDQEGAAAYRPAPHDGVAVKVDGGVVVLAISGCLDAAAGEALAVAASAAVAERAHRLDIDLRAVEAFTPEGASSLLACRELSDGLAEGLHYRTGRGPGRQALLAAYAGRVAGHL